MRHADADLGIAAGRHKGHLFIKGQNVAVVPEDEMVDSLLHYAERILEEGADAVLAGADLNGARRAAEADRAALLDEKGVDANASEVKVDLIRRHLDER